jgi:hypothetical protein
MLINKLKLLLAVNKAMNGKKTDTAQILIIGGLLLTFFGLEEERKQLEAMSPDLIQAVDLIIQSGAILWIWGVGHKIVKGVQLLIEKRKETAIE